MAAKTIKALQVRRNARPAGPRLITDSVFTEVKWPRGPARIDGDFVVLEAGAQSFYDPMKEPRLPLELAEIDRPAKAIKFVERYGLIRRAPLTPGPLPEQRQPYQEFQHAAEWLSKLVRVETLLISAMNPKETRDKPADVVKADALRDLRRWFFSGAPEPWAYHVLEELGPYLTNPEVRDREAHRLLRHDDEVDQQVADTVMPNSAEPRDDVFMWKVAYWLTLALSKTGLDKLTAWGSVRHRTGRLSFDLSHSMRGNLMTACCFHLFSHLEKGRPVRRCEDCGNPFPVHDKRQRFCNTTCQERAKKHRQRHPND